MKKRVVFFHVIFLLMSCSVTQIKINKEQDRVLLSNSFILNDSSLKLIENSLNIKDLEEYLHFELSNRLPLILIYDQIKENEKYIIDCFGHSVRVVKSQENITDGSIILLYAFQSSTTINLIFKYPIEGIKLIVEYNLDEETKVWKIVSKEIVEY